ncbi:MAG: hypothetical protein A3E01_18685 [Gammaproteobacteria bacterium RIFCSPHIGHO2_12_FULL_63_22]|nr:MAG: hypothetical protein A3E01_18685 [Gammaproteobacteria bacterium RIFCSPHIGHO2_12_FULL_63_22]
MNVFRRHRLRFRLSIVVIVALLWSQAILASHSICSIGNLALAKAPVSTAVEHDCHAVPPVKQSSACDAHCSQGDQSNDVGRVPPVPFMAAASVFACSAVVRLDVGRASCAELPPPISWHRPTVHPAHLLLI